MSSGAAVLTAGVAVAATVYVVSWVRSNRKIRTTALIYCIGFVFVAAPGAAVKENGNLAAIGGSLAAASLLFGVVNRFRFDRVTDPRTARASEADELWGWPEYMVVGAVAVAFVGLFVWIFIVQ